MWLCRFVRDLLIALLAALLAPACTSASTCLRNTDCLKGATCVAGSCVVLAPEASAEPADSGTDVASAADAH